MRSSRSINSHSRLQVIREYLKGIRKYLYLRQGGQLCSQRFLEWVAMERLVWSFRGLVRHMRLPLLSAGLQWAFRSILMGVAFLGSTSRYSLGNHSRASDNRWDH